jgi:tetratricopeptide (TPR) repeat protein
LALFRKALSLDPYHYGAHTHVLGIEFLLGLHEDLHSEIQIYKTLYPNDPSSMYVQAIEYAMDGHSKEAEAALSSVKGQTDNDVFRQLQTGCRITAAMAASLDLDACAEYLKTNRHEGIIGMLPVPQMGLASCPADLLYPVRMPQLPCLTQGLETGYTGVRSLTLGLLSDPSAAVERIKSAHEVYPEALPPLLGGMLLEKMLPRARIGGQHLRSLQAELFELASHSSSMYPNVPRLARYLAIRTEYSLAIELNPMSQEGRQSCIRNIQNACMTGKCSKRELSDYFDFALGLEDFDLARVLLIEWQGAAGENPIIRQRRIDLDIASGALDEAQEQLDQILDHNPGDRWALDQKAVVLQKVKKIAVPHQ